MSCTCPETNWMDGKGHDLGCPLRKQESPRGLEHRPLMFNAEGEEIRGLKCCMFCGLSETYWDRWPACESRSQAKRLEIQAGGRK